MKNKKDIILIASLFLGLSGLGFGYKFFASKNYNKEAIHSTKFENKTKNEDESIEKSNTSLEIYIHIDGEVNNPGLYKLFNGDRIDDAIRAAGGLTADADKSKINLAIKLTDEMKIHIYKKGESHAESINNLNNSNSNNKLVNINTASIEELCKLPGIGENKAKLIVEYREKHKFTKIEDITKVSGIGKKTFEKIKNEITVE